MEKKNNNNQSKNVLVSFSHHKPNYIDGLWPLATSTASAETSLLKTKLLTCQNNLY